MRTLLCIALLFAFGGPLGAQSARIAQIPGMCVPPQRPLLDEGSLKILGISEGEELSRYMDEAQAYSLCLDATKQQLYAEVNNYLEREAHKE